MMVIAQLPSEVASRSVGEKASPLPLLSTGASVISVLPERTWVAWVLKFPGYVVSIVGIFYFVKQLITNYGLLIMSVQNL